MDEQKTCNRCGETKTLAGFYFKKGKPGAWCRGCYRQWHRERYAPKHGTDDEPRQCAHCGSTYQPKSRRLSIYCSRKCLQDYRVESGKERDQHLRRKYGITADDYDRMLAEQGGGCGICGRTAEEQTRYTKYLHIDHDHTTGSIRGLLCGEHNLLLGRWGDGIDLLVKAIEYLKRKE